MHRREFLTAAGALVLAGCARAAPRPVTADAITALPSSAAATSRPTETTTAPPTRGTPKEILARSTVPVLCFHQLRDFRAEDSEYARTMITPPPVFRTQLQALRDGGYTPTTADALIQHLQFGSTLPARPVLLTFDDGSETHFSVAWPTLRDFGFPATFFPMTVVLNKPDWLSEAQLRQLDQSGITIGAHTWDHQRMDRLTGDQWQTELIEPKARLAEILGHPVDLLAYPFGVWSQETLTRVAQAGYQAAFQLAEAQDPAQPLLTIRRIMPPPTWDSTTLLDHLTHG